MIAPFPLLFFGGDISVFMEEGYETVAVDDFIKFKSPKRIANLVKVCVVFRISLKKVNYSIMTYGLFHTCHKERINCRHYCELQLVDSGGYVVGKLSVCAFIF